jgi:hypothetical protein
MQPLLTLLLAIQIGPGGAGVEYREPHLAANDRMVAVAFGAGQAIYFAASTDRGRTFSAPVKVAEVNRLALGRHRGPRVAITPDAVVITAMAADGGAPGAQGDLRTWRSTDGGRTWLAGGRVNDVAASAREGLHTMTAAPDGTIFAAWLDLRDKGTRLYSAMSKDGGASWTSNALVYESPSGTICQCCHPTALIDGKGAIHAMWRNVVGESRDMYTAVSTDGGRSFKSAVKLGNGTWTLNACPMDGGGLAIDAHGRVVSIWRREGDVYLAEKGGAERKIEAGKDPAIAAGADGIYAVWIADGAVRALAPGREPFTLAAKGAAPQIVAVPGGPALAAWDEAGRIVVEPIGK